MKISTALLLAVGLAACSPANGEPPSRIRLGIEHSSFVPSSIEVGAGSTVTFTIHNGDPIEHEFILGDDEVQERHEAGTERRHGAVPGEVTIPAGATRTTTYTFGGAGRLTFACHIPGHFAYGMRGEVTILD